MGWSRLLGRTGVRCAQYTRGGMLRVDVPACIGSLNGCDKMSTDALAIASLLITTYLRQGPDCHDF